MCQKVALQRVPAAALAGIREEEAGRRHTTRTCGWQVHKRHLAVLILKGLVPHCSQCGKSEQVPRSVTQPGNDHDMLAAKHKPHVLHAAEAWHVAHPPAWLRCSPALSRKLQPSTMQAISSSLSMISPSRCLNSCSRPAEWRRSSPIFRCQD